MPVTGIVECLEIIDLRCNLEQFDGLIWLTLTPVFYDRSTPLNTAASVAGSWNTLAKLSHTVPSAAVASKWPWVPEARDLPRPTCRPRAAVRWAESREWSARFGQLAPLSSERSHRTRCRLDEASRQSTPPVHDLQFIIHTAFTH